MRSDKVRGMWSVARRGAGAVLMAGLVTVSAGSGAGQRTQQQGGGGGRGQQSPPTTVFDQPSDIPVGVRAHMDAERTRMLNDDRHKRLTQDVDRLVALTNELKAEVDKTDKDEIPDEDLRKMAEIERLAHDVQNRMKN